MRSGIAGIDHVIVAVRDLERARAAWHRLGFSVSPRGRHIGQPTANYCIMFAADYLELLGIADPAPPTDPAQSAPGGLRPQALQEFLTAREGLMAAAFAPERSAAEARDALLQLGLHPSDPHPLGRRIESAEGRVGPRFSLVSLPPEETPGLDCFLCEQLTPELMRRPEWVSHPNGVTGLAGIHVLVESTTGLLPAYDRLFGIPQVTTTDAVAAVYAGHHRIVFSTPDDFQTMHPALELAADIPLPAIMALDLVVARAGDTADFLGQHQIEFAQMPDGAIAVPARTATGAILFFAEE